MKNLTKIIALINKYWAEIKLHLFKVEVDNLPDVQKVEVTNPQEAQSSMEVSNLEEIREALKENAVNIIEVLEKQMTELKVEPTDNSDIIKGLKEIKEKIKIEKDLTPEVIKRLEGIGKEIGGLDTKPDLSGLESHLEASYSLIESLKDYTEYDEWKVKINEKQIEKLSKAMGKTIVSSGIGTIKDGQGRPYSSSNKLPVDATLEVGDIEIGAVEIKNATTDDRVIVDGDGNLQTEVNNTVTVDCNSSDVTVDNFPAVQAVSATNLDIRDLDSSIDSVEVKQATASNLKAEVEVSNQPTVNPSYLVNEGSTSYDVDSSAVQIFDASSNADATFVIVANCGDDEIYIYSDNTVSSTKFFKRIAAGESWEFPMGYTSDTANDLYAERKTSQGNDDVIVTVFKDN